MMRILREWNIITISEVSARAMLEGDIVVTGFNYLQISDSLSISINLGLGYTIHTRLNKASANSLAAAPTNRNLNNWYVQVDVSTVWDKKGHGCTDADGW